MTRAPTLILCLATTFGSAPVLAVDDAMVLRSIEARLAELTIAGIGTLVPSSRRLREGKRERRAIQEEIRALEAERAQSAKPQRRIGLVPGWHSGLTIGWID